MTASIIVDHEKDEFQPVAAYSKPGQSHLIFCVWISSTSMPLTCSTARGTGAGAHRTTS